eukprot:CAMPEP_0202872612 /NCGR_PEP_ID=MMETSP1391-20130828/21641_1 /ASSEMBLY_ACC=CAM_ASM_000867 /TAXON_ID=1034604 /ORGANISM="Chlamydomonas leiostraca, Strain SAG 11-49" /LENGTH=282 /DNA_ID=CAMNT_0049553705 /DNA_START=18 /DNA_END=867 /DNA_ORIENTATION=+
MADSLSHEDQEVYSRLKAKYSTGAPGIPLDPNAASDQLTEWKASQVSADKPGTVSYRKGSNVEARMCPICQGSGVQREEYNHRRLERMCTSCEGKGITVYRDGQLVEDPPARNPAHQPNDNGSNRHSSSGDSASSTSSQEDEEQQQEAASKRAAEVAARCAKLRMDVAQIEARCAAYEMERAAVQAGLSQPAGAGSEAEVAARTELLRQLDLQLGRLRDLAGRKRAHADKLGGSTNVVCSIDAIVAHESPDVDGEGVRLPVLGVMEVCCVCGAPVALVALLV